MRGRGSATAAPLAALLALAALLVPAALRAEDPAPGDIPPAIVLSPGVLAETAARLAGGDPALGPPLRALLRDADAAMAAPAESVVLKPAPPPGGDMHDYWSLAPASAPESGPAPCDGDFDRLRIRRMARHALTLALAWRLSGKEDYAGKGTALLWAWCSDSLTRTRPAMDHAHARPGADRGSHTGIMETRDMIAAAEAACLLATSPAWSAAVDRSVRGWLAEYLHWLRSSDFGRLAAADAGCLGLWHAAQVAALARCTGNDELARATAEGARPRMAALLAPGTPAPDRLALRAMLTLAAVAEGAGADLWHTTGLRRALDAGHPDGGAGVADCADRLYPPDDAPLFHRAAMVYKEPAYRDLAGQPTEGDRVWLAR